MEKQQFLGARTRSHCSAAHPSDSILEKCALAVYQALSKPKDKVRHFLRPQILQDWMWPVSSSASTDGVLLSYSRTTVWFLQYYSEIQKLLTARPFRWFFSSFTSFPMVPFAFVPMLPWRSRAGVRRSESSLVKAEPERESVGLSLLQGEQSRRLLWC